MSDRPRLQDLGNQLQENIKYIFVFSGSSSLVKRRRGGWAWHRLLSQSLGLHARNTLITCLCGDRG